MDMWREINPGEDVPQTVNTVVVTPKDSLNIYSYDHERDILVHDHSIHGPFSPPGDLGFIPRSYSEGNTPLDVIVLGSYPNPPETLIEARPIGLLRLTVNEVRDDTVIVVPVNDRKEADDISQLDSHLKEEIRRFYKSLFQAQERVVRIGDLEDADAARQSVERGLKLYNRKFGIPDEF